MARRAKIVATLGPASDRPFGIAQLVDAGIDVARMNLAHGEADEHVGRATTLREEAAARGRTVGILADLPGPKIRTGPIVDGEVELHEGAPFVLSAGSFEGNEGRVSTSFDKLPECVGAGDPIYLADGSIVLEVKSVETNDVRTEVVRGGVLRSGKGMHVPSAEDLFDPLSAADSRALETAATLGADLVGASFVRNAADINAVRAAFPPGYEPLVVAKIETAAAVKDIEAIVNAADAVMVARGDLGIQVALQEVPRIQKLVISACNAAATPVIVATQMLESMTRSPLPTRAEVSDVANAILDGTDAVMLSEETAIGDDPPRVVRTMNDIIVSAEKTPAMRGDPVVPDDDDAVSWAIARAAARIADAVGVAAIVCPTRTGATARRVSAFRPLCPIVGPIEDHVRAGALSLTWGVTPVAMASEGGRTEDRAVAAAKDAGILRAGAVAVVVAGSPTATAGSTDRIQVLRA
ncbi:MAG: pyruvate kinase [Actinomycetota bacterium]